VPANPVVRTGAKAAAEATRVAAMAIFIVVILCVQRQSLEDRSTIRVCIGCVMCDVWCVCFLFVDVFVPSLCA